MKLLGRFFGSLALSSLALALACDAPVVTVEVLPPRSGVSCSTPGADDPALGRGLLDAHAVNENNGAYRADLRLVVTGANARIDGIDVRVTRDGDEVELLGDVPTGDVLLVGEGDDIRKGVVENVELLPRSIALDLSKDTKITVLDLATLELEISPIVLDANVTPASSTFALDVCNGCLVDEPDTETCPFGAFQNNVCRVGQDAELWSCLPPSAGAGAGAGG
jgi:hypothetical protein